MALTDDQKIQYLADSVHCPYCKSDNIEGKGFDVMDDQAAQEIHCIDCGKRWTDIYKIVDIEERE